MAAPPTAAPNTAERARFREYLRECNARRTAAWERRREDAWRVAREAARRLRSEFSAGEVWVFGSLGGGGIFDDHSDIDLAATGVPDAAYLDAVRMLLGLDAAFLIDLVRLEAAPDGLREVVMTGGVSV
jgi:uncharacterized protein